MKLSTILELAHFGHGGPLKSLNQIFGDNSLATWLESGLGEAMCECLDVTLVDLHKESHAIKYLSILDAIIPPVPGYESGYSEYPIHYKSTTSDPAYLNLVDKLISKIKRPLFGLTCKSSWLIAISLKKVLLKVLFYAKEKVLNDNVDYFCEVIYKSLDSGDATFIECEANLCLSILDAIIPPEPILREFQFHSNSITSKSVYCENFNIVKKLMSKIIKPLIPLAYKFHITMPSAMKVLFKAIFYAEEMTIIYNISQEFFKFCEFQVCNDFSYVFMGSIILLARKMSRAWIQSFLNPKVILHIRFIVMSNEQNECPYVNSLCKLYNDLEFDKMLEMKLPSWILLLDAKQMFDDQNFVMALKCVSQLLDDEKMCVQQFIQSEVLHKLNSLLCNPAEFGQESFVIKSFLAVILKFETVAENNYIFSSGTFKKLVQLVVKTAKYCETNLLGTRNFNAKNSTLVRGGIVSFRLLQCLHVLNYSWHQWFDILEGCEIIDGELLQCRDINYRRLDFYFQEPDEGAHFFNGSLATTFPELFPRPIRVERANSIPQDFEISRSNVLGDIFRVFERSYKDLYSEWRFTFKGEIGSGRGVTKEVYSILSQELQRHDFQLWQGEPVKRSDDEVLYTFSPNGLFPKENGDTERFRVLGRILAKVISDGYLLDIPLSNKLFQLLTIRKQSHLTREYFDLIHYFPMLKSLLKQLLPVKSKIDAIRSEVGLTQRQKNEIISNLTFDDGNSFDDLCVSFTVPGTDVELIENGRDVLLSPHNIDLYLEKLCLHKNSIKLNPEIHALRRGFYEIIPIKLFAPEDLKYLICCKQFQRWTSDDLRKCCRYENSQSVEFLFECLASLDVKDQKLFLRFVTSMSSLPIGGLSVLKPPLTIRKAKREPADAYLPTTLTCLNLIYLPDYTSLQVTMEKILLAIHEGNGSFAFV